MLRRLRGPRSRQAAAVGAAARLVDDQHATRPPPGRALDEHGGSATVVFIVGESVARPTPGRVPRPVARAGRRHPARWWPATFTSGSTHAHVRAPAESRRHAGAAVPRVDRRHLRARTAGGRLREHCSATRAAAWRGPGRAVSRRGFARAGCLIAGARKSNKETRNAPYARRPVTRSRRRWTSARRHAQERGSARR